MAPGQFHRVKPCSLNANPIVVPLRAFHHDLCLCTRSFPIFSVTVTAGANHGGFHHLKTLQNRKLVMKSMNGGNGCSADDENGRAAGEMAEQCRGMMEGSLGEGWRSAEEI